MKTRHLSTAFVLCVLVALAPVVQVYGDGTETLGAISIVSGTHIVAAGTGLHSQPGSISISVPGGATIKQVLLYWEGQDLTPAVGDDTLIVDGTEITGALIGGPTLFFANVEVMTYRADITGYDFVVPGVAHIFSISGAEFEHRNDGAGILVIYDDGSRDVVMEARDGQDLAYVAFAPPLDTTVPQTFTFPASASDQTAELAMFFGSVSDAIDRPNFIEITVDGVVTTLVNPLGSLDGLEWDTLSTSVLVPAGVTSLTVQALSDYDGSANQPASLAWINVSLTIGVDVPCTGSIGDFVWDDLNGDGIQDAGEPGIAGVLVTLYDAGLTPIAATATDSAGAYLFTDLCAGRYNVGVDESTLPVGYVPTLTNVGDPALDSDVNPVAVSLPADDTQDLTIDFGYLLEDECGPCLGKVSELTLLYLGDVDDAHIVVTRRGKGRNKPGVGVFDGIVQPGETFAFIGNDKKNTLGPEITITINGEFATDIHTSCSQPIGIGFIYGDFQIVAGASRNGGALCAILVAKTDSATAVDIQTVINEVLGVYTGFNCDMSGDNSVDAEDIQIVVNNTLGL
jgi:hypothetical protein